MSNVAGTPRDRAGRAALDRHVAGRLATLAFGTVAVGSSEPLAFNLTNSGNATANIAYAGFENAPYTASPDLFALLGGSLANVTVTFAPPATGSAPASHGDHLGRAVLADPGDAGANGHRGVEQ